MTNYVFNHRNLINKVIENSRIFTILFLGAILFLSANISAQAATFTVTKTADTNDNVCETDCSLREAIAAANAASSDDVIEFASTVFSTAQTITLGGTHLEINNNGSLTIKGTSANLLTVSANNASRVFFINAGVNVIISGIRITGGMGGQGAGIYNGGKLTLNGSIVNGNTSGSNNGGGIFNDGSNSILNVNDSTVSNNTGNGAGIFNFNGTTNITNSSVINNTGINGAGILNVAGGLTLTDSSVSNNSAGGGGGIGGGILNSSGIVTATSSIINNNIAAIGGGGIDNDNGTLTFIKMTISGNKAGNGSGAGISNHSGGIVNLTNSTISNNEAGSGAGGGISNSSFNSVMTLNVVTISGNSARAGGGISNANSATITLTDSAIVNNLAINGGAGVTLGSGTVNLTNTTVASNTAGTFGGGGISLGTGTVNLTNTTIVKNTCGALGGGGIRSGDGTAVGTVNSHNSIIADNNATDNIAPDVFGKLTSQGFNLIENISGMTLNGTTAGNILGQDPQVLPLGNYGGATQTIALQPTSPAIDAADPNNFPETDQRGIARPQDGDANGSSLPDIGAFELRAVVVTNSNDSGAGSLRQAIADVVSQGDAVVFNPNLFNSPKTIVLTSGELVIPINANITIKGTGADKLTISGNNQSRVFFINSGANVTLNSLTITNGNAGLGDGGGIFIDSTIITSLNVNNSIITNNVAGSNTMGGSGGGIYDRTFGNITVSNSAIINNFAGSFSGAIQSNIGNLNVINSEITGNKAMMGAGGISISLNGNSSFGTGNIVNSSITNNTAESQNGGGIINNGTLNITNSTISGNSAGGDGGGIRSIRNLNITHSTISNNRAGIDGSGEGGGIRNAGASFVIFRNTIIADNTRGAGDAIPDEFRGNLNSQGYNLVETINNQTIVGSTNLDVQGADPQLLPLDNNGGLTQTHALRPTSPAIDKGNSSGVTTDQRGQSRPFNNPIIPNAPGGDGADIGAFERQPEKYYSTAPFDFDGDGKSDISVFRPSLGSWYLLQSSNSSFLGLSFGLGTDIIAPADYDGDGKTDFAVFRPDSGSWYLQQSTNGFAGVQFGQNGDIPVPADYDGDGEDDIAVFRPSTGGWYRLNSSNSQFIAVAFGMSEDKPTIGDFDGDGKSDIAVFRPSTANWFRLNSSNNQFVAVQFGAAEDKLTPADFDGDGKTDIAVYRPSAGGWYRLNSSNGEFVAVGFGTSEDKPVPADYDGDGKADIAVFRPSDGNWYLLRSTAGFTAVQFGQTNDKPIPNAFVQ